MPWWIPDAKTCAKAGLIGTALYVACPVREPEDHTPKEDRVDHVPGMQSIGSAGRSRLQFRHAEEKLQVSDVATAVVTRGTFVALTEVVDGEEIVHEMIVPVERTPPIS